MKLTPGDFISLMEDSKKENSVRFGTVDTDYISGRPNIIFDGNDTASTKKYPYLSSYTPTANDRVMIIKNVIVGKII